MVSVPETLSGRPLLATRHDQALFVDPGGAGDRLLEAVRHRFNVLVLGERGMGKTSLLHHLSHRLREEKDAPRAVYVDAALATNAVEFLQLVRHGLGQRIDALGEALASSPFSGGGHPLPEVGQLLRLLRDLGQGEGEEDRRTTVLADGLAAQVAQSVFGRLRDELWQLPLRWVVSGDLERRADYLRPPADAFFDLILTLEPLEPAGQRELLARRLGQKALTATVPDELLARSGGNPRRLLSLAREAMASVEGSQAILSADARWRARLEGLSRPSRMLIAELEARGVPASASDPELLASLGWTRARAAQVLRELEGAGLAESAQERPAKGPGRPRKVYSLRRQDAAA